RGPAGVGAGPGPGAGGAVDVAAVFAAERGGGAGDGLAQGIEAIFRRGGARHGRLVPAARATLLELRRRGYRLGVATNDSLGGLEASLGPHDILSLFEFKVGADCGFGAKPEPGLAFA